MVHLGLQDQLAKLFLLVCFSNHQMTNSKQAQEVELGCTHDIPANYSTHLHQMHPQLRTLRLEAL